MSVLPKLPRDAGDRNRTSPFAFTGNKFEFRAVSSNQSIALPNIVPERRRRPSRSTTSRPSSRTSSRRARSCRHAVKALLTKLIKDNKRIIFNGNNYSDEWQKEAAKRGLLNLRNVGRRLPRADEAGRRQGVREVRRAERARASRAVRGRLEQYNKTINIEAQLMVLMANRYILPAAYKHQEQLAKTVAAVKAAGATAKETRRALDRLCRLTDERKVRVDRLQELLEHEGDGDAEKHAKYFRDKVIPAMAALREVGDALEGIVPHDIWPLPTYREMLFVK